MIPTRILDVICNLRNRMSGQVMGLASMILLAVFHTLPALSQEPVPSDLYRERPRNEGNRIVFCLRPLGHLASFEAELADTIGQVLMTEVRTHTVAPANFPVRPTGYEFNFGLTYEQIFILMAERCDVLLGMYLGPGAPEWLRLSRPYVSARVLGVSTNPDIERFEDIAPGAKVAAQALAAGDAALIRYSNAQAKDRAWQRTVYRDNRSLMNALNEHAVDAALIWEGALMAGTDGDLTRAGLHVMQSLPFPVEPVMISAAVRTGDNFLGVQIDEALSALEADGSLLEMAKRHKIILPDAP